MVVVSISAVLPKYILNTNILKPGHLPGLSLVSYSALLFFFLLFLKMWDSSAVYVLQIGVTVHDTLRAGSGYKKTLMGFVSEMAVPCWVGRSVCIGTEHKLLHPEQKRRRQSLVSHSHKLL